MSKEWDPGDTWESDKREQPSGDGGLDNQLEDWVAGRSWCPNDRGECCPDFSCCIPQLKVEKSVRQEFFDADEERREQMCEVILSGFYGWLKVAEKRGRN